MSPRTRTWLKVAAVGVVSVLAVVVAVTAWLFGSEAGARFAFARIAAAAPGDLDAERIRGRIGGMTLENMTYEDDGLLIRARRVELSWRPRALLRRRLDVSYVRAHQVWVEQRENPDAEKPGEPITELPEVDFSPDLMLGEVRIDSLALLGPGAAEPTRIDAAWLEEVALRDTLTVRRVVVRAREYEMDGGLWLLPKGDYPLHARIAWKVRPPDGPEIAGEGTLEGSLMDLRFGQRLSGGVDGVIDGTVVSLLHEPRLNADLALQGIELTEWNAGLPPGTASGRIHLEGPLASVRGQGVLGFRLREYGEIDGRFALARDGDAWQLDDLRITSPGRALAVTADARVEPLDDGVRFQLDAEWRDFVWPLGGDTTVASPKGSLRAWGTDRSYRTVARAALQGPAVPPGDWRLAGHGGRDHLVVDALEGETLGGQVRGEGLVNWSAVPRWRAQLVGRNLDPSVRWPEWPGSLSVAASTRGVMGRAGPEGRVELERIGGHLRQRPVTGRAAIGLRGAVAHVDTLALQVGQSTVGARGFVGQRLDLGWRVSAPQLGDLVPDADGALEAEGRLAGSATRPRLIARASGDSLRWDQTYADHLTLETDLDLSPGGRVELDLEGRGIAAGDPWAVDSLTAIASGPTSNHTLEVAAVTGPQQLQLALAGGWDGRSWQGRIGTLNLISPRTGDWQLREPAALSWSAERARLTGLCWVSGSSSLCADADWSAAAGWSTQANLDEMRLAVLEPLLPPGSTLEGVADGRLEAGADAAGRLRLDLDVAAGPGVFRFGTYAGSDSARFDRATVRAATEGGALRAEAEVSFPGSGTARADLALPGFGGRTPAAGQSMDGRIVLDFDRLGLVEAFAPQLQGVQGTLDADLRIGGTVGDPQLLGTVRLAGSQATLPELGITLRDFSLDAESRGNRELSLRGEAHSGTGRLTVRGDSRLDPGGALRVEARVEGENFLAYDARDQVVVITPALDLTLVGDSARVTGEVRVPQAHIEYEDLREDATVPTSPDVVYVGDAEDPRRRSAVRVFAEVRVILGDEVELEGSGLVTRATGSLVLIESPGTPTRASGELQLVEGSYRAYGQDLTIERGRLFYGGGSVMNPGLDLRVSRTAGDGTVAGFEIDGTLQQPQLAVFSDPGMAERDALSYVIFGRPLDRAGQQEAGVVSRAADRLGVKGGNWIARTVGSEFGLDEASIESQGSLEEASLVLGTYLSPRLFVKYGVGLFDSATRLNINYILSSKWTLQAEVSEENRASLLYKIEK